MRRVLKQLTRITYGQWDCKELLLSTVYISVLEFFLIYSVHVLQLYLKKTKIWFLKMLYIDSFEKNYFCLYF